MSRTHRILLVVVVALAVSTSARASQVRSLDLETMTDRADRIVLGRCVEVERTHDANLGFDVTRVTFEIERAVKGDAETLLTIRLLAGPGARQSAVADLRFQPGEEFVLFLYPDSTMGLTSPVGLGQGQFPVFRDKRGKRQVAVRESSVSSQTAVRLGIGAADAPRRHIEPGLLLDWSERLLAPGSRSASRTGVSR